MMLVWVLVLTALLASDVAGANNSTEPEETLQNIGCHGLPRGPCARHWYYYRPARSCYRFFHHRLRWVTAEHYCRRVAHHGHLPSIRSCHQNAFISRVIYAGRGGRRAAWIGLNDICRERHFRWIDRSPFRYSRWAHREPNNAGNEDCVETNFRHVGLWNDVRCHARRNFVCSYRLHCD